MPPIRGRCLHDRVVVADPEAAAALRHGALGTPHAAGTLLSFTEAAYLARRGTLEVDADVEAIAGARQHHFATTMATYADLRGRGVVPRSGFRFGTHLRAYTGCPDDGHAVWLLQCAAPDDALHWSELSRAVRLAHGVRKTFLLAVVDGEAVQYVAMTWHRP